MKHPCPNCGYALISSFRKGFIASVGPLSRVRCSRCGSNIGVPFLLGTAFIVLLAFVPWFAVWGVLQFVPAPMVLSMAALAFCAGFFGSSAIMLWLYIRFAPLVSKDS